MGSGLARAAERILDAQIDLVAAAPVATMGAAA